MSLLSWLNPIENITKAIVDWQRVKEEAKNDADRIRAEQKIEELRAKRDVQVASTVHDKWYGPRSLIGYIVVVFLGKLFLWDTVLGLGVTPHPGNLIMEITSVVVAFYFVSEGLRGIFKR